MPVDVTPHDRHEHVARLTLDFGRLNLITADRLRSLVEALDSLPRGVSVLVVTGAGDGLTGGLDLEWARDLTAHEGWTLLSRLYEALEAVRDIDAVTVCGAGSYALGAGFELALACDFRVAVADAALGLPEVDVGLPTVVHGGLLTRFVGLQTAKELIYLAEPVSGRRAYELGLVNEAVPADEYEPTVSELTDRLATRSSTVLTWQKRVFRAWRSWGLEAGMAHSVGLGAQCFGTPDQREAMTAFLEDREPSFDHDPSSGNI